MAGFSAKMLLLPVPTAYALPCLRSAPSPSTRWSSSTSGRDRRPARPFTPLQPLKVAESAIRWHGLARPAKHSTRLASIHALDPKVLALRSEDVATVQSTVGSVGVTIPRWHDHRDR